MQILTKILLLLFELSIIYMQCTYSGPVAIHWSANIKYMISSGGSHPCMALLQILAAEQ